MADVALSQSPENRVADGMHQHVCVGVAFQTSRVRDFDTPKIELPSFHQTMHIVANPNMVHGPHYRLTRPMSKRETAG
jgi:hypothetical protein